MVGCNDKSFEVYIKFPGFSLEGFFRIWRLQYLASQVLALGDVEPEGGKIRNTSLEDCSHILKGNVRIENLVRFII